MSKTSEKIAEMLKENTGRHFLDSGGAYGRHWERNQGRDFAEEPPTTLSFRYGEISVTHNVYHWLDERLSIDEDANRAFLVMQRWKRMAGAGGDSYLQDMIDFPAFFGAWKARQDEEDRDSCDACDGVGYEETSLCEKCHGRGWLRFTTLRYDSRKGFLWDGGDYHATRGSVPGGIYAEGDPLCVYTYNEDNLLSQDIQFVYFSFPYGGAEYVVLQVHGGCDARGGFTVPVVFEVCGDELAMFDYRRASIGCTGRDHARFATLKAQTSFFVEDEFAESDRDHYWTTDNGSNWYYQGSCGLGAGTQLEDYDQVYLVSDDEFAALLEEHYDEEGATKEEVLADLTATIEGDGKVFSRTWRKGRLCIDEAQNCGYCPHCGGRLGAGF